MGRKSVTYLDYLCCRAEERFTRGRYLIKFRSYGITNVQGRGRNGLTLLETFLGHFIESPLLELFLLRIMGTSLSLSLKKIITPCPSWIEYFQKEIFEEFWPFLKWIGTQWRFWAGVVVELSGWKWMTIPRVGDCLTRHFEASKEMDTQSRKTDRLLTALKYQI